MKERDSNIELLRILATIFILILHCNGWFLREWGGITGWNTGNSIVAACRIDPVFSWFVRKDVMYFTNDIYPIYCVKIGAVIAGVFAAAIVLDKIRLFIFSPLIKWSGKIKQLN